MNFHPPEQLPGSLITLRRYRLSDGKALAESVEASRDHLLPWMPWAAGDANDPSTAEYLRSAVTEFGCDHGADYAMIFNEEGSFVGSCGLMPRVGQGALEIGYWVDARYLRRGIATQAAELLTTAAFGDPEVERVEIHVEESNDASNAVPRRLGYRLDRTEPRNASDPEQSRKMLIWLVSRAEWDRREP
jgi:RimJ/RimL family protein N-acetyltransferase